MKRLSQLLEEYSKSSFYPMHMPGHKRNTDLLGAGLPYNTDITEISGFDDLHAPTGVIKDIQESLKSFYDCRESFLLVNGSTCGIMAAITSVCSFGDKIIAARNCHRSVYKAIELYNLKPVWVMPQISIESGICGEISPESIRSAIEQNADAGLVVVTSPTYEGVISDLHSIAEICHSAGIPLLCDMAHGAHFPLFDELSSAYKEADIVITSLHKTLPCLTQTACVNIYSDRISADSFTSALQIFETSSPSYLLMSSADRCMALIESRKDELVQKHRERIGRFRKMTAHLKNLRIIGKEYRTFDPTKLVIGCNNTSVNGKELFDILRDKYQIECEMASARYIIAMTGICDTDEGIVRLAEALCETDITLTHKQNEPFTPIFLPDAACTAYESAHSEHDVSPLDDCIGKICGEYILAYPPGIPVISPGEIITAQSLDIISSMRKNGLSVRSMHSDSIATIIR